jgi:hypothetical protein
MVDVVMVDQVRVIASEAEVDGNNLSAKGWEWK